MSIPSLRKIISRVFNPDGSVSVDDPEIIKSFTDRPDFPYLVSFPRTGSHWLRMIMELYFEKPSLVRAFYFKEANDFTCYHTHDIELKLHRENVIYLYRNPAETIYSQLCYYKENPESEERRQHWTNLYARHLVKWLLHDDFTKKKTIVTYEEMKSDMRETFVKICAHFGKELDSLKLDSALAKVSKNELKKKTTHDEQVVNLTEGYNNQRKKFILRHSERIYTDIFSVEPELRNWLQKGATSFC